MPVTSRLVSAAVTLALAITTASFAPSAGPEVVRAALDTPRRECAAISLNEADELMANRYTFSPHPTVTLPENPTWAEDPLADRNWQYQYHTLRFVRNLLHKWAVTEDDAYRGRALFLLQDWLNDNPRDGAPSPFSWNDHSTAWRAMTMVCAAEAVGLPEWLEEGLDLHGRVLADPSFYVNHGNHALNQAIGLLDIGCTMGRSDWKSLARKRLDALVLESIDKQGVTNEQSVEYQAYNHTQYTTARNRLIACGITPSAAFDRVDKMATFLAHATLPNGRYEQIGDTSRAQAKVIEGTIAEFAATQGASGPRPTVTDRIFRSSGWFFARTGWGTKRPYADEVHTSLRFGPARAIHGHFDGGALTMYGYGSRLLVDPGKYKYEKDAWRTWFVGRTAHNVVTVDGLAFGTTAATRLVAHRTSNRHTDTTVSNTGYSGVTNRRRVVFSRRLGYVLVEDRLRSTTKRRFRQHWHLPEDARPFVGTTGILTRRSRGNLVIRQLIGTPRIRIVKGATSPIQGWVSYDYGSRIAAPVVEARKTGTKVRFLTLIVPGDAGPKVRIGSLRVTSKGYSVVVTVNGRSEKVTVTSTSSSIRTP